MDARQAAQVAAIAAAYAAQQRLLAAEWMRDLVALVRAVFRPFDPAGSWPGLLDAVTALIGQRHRAAAGMAARYYLDLRAASGVPAPRPRVDPFAALAPGRRVAPPPLATADDALAWLDRTVGVRPTPLVPERVDATVRATGIASFQRAVRAGQDPGRAADTMAVSLAGATQELVLEGARELVHDAVQADREAIGWARVTDADPCPFCAMMASRGAVYKSAESAGRAQNKRFVGAGMFKWHNHCGCVAVPVFAPDDPVLRTADVLYDRWVQATRGKSGKAAVKAWAQYWDELPAEEKPTAGGVDGGLQR